MKRQSFTEEQIIAILREEAGVCRRPRRLALHRAQQAAAKRPQRELQWPPPGDELLNEMLVRSLPHPRAVLEAWRRDYTEERPHSKLGPDAAEPERPS